MAYIASIWWQHLLHRVLVFGSGAKYWTSLAMTYGTYTLSWVLSTGAQYVLTAHLFVDHRTAWALTLVGTGFLNYFTLQQAFLPEDRKTN